MAGTNPSLKLPRSEPFGLLSNLCAETRDIQSLGHFSMRIKRECVQNQKGTYVSLSFYPGLECGCSCPRVPTPKKMNSKLGNNRESATLSP